MPYNPFSHFHFISKVSECYKIDEIAFETGNRKYILIHEKLYTVLVR